MWAYIKADENGNFTATIDRPTVANSNLKEELQNGDKVAIYLLSGSLAENDNARGGVAVEYTFTTSNQQQNNDAKTSPSNPSVPEPSAPADSKDQVKKQDENPAKDQNKAPADSLKSEAQKKDNNVPNSAPKTTGSSSQNGTSSNASSSSNSSKSSLANTGASGVVVAAGIGVLALVIGATVLVARRRKA